MRLEHALKHCPGLQAAADHVRSFAALLITDNDANLPENTARLDSWIAQVRDAPAVPTLRSFAEGLLIDHDAAGLALPYSNRPAEGVVNKIKLLNASAESSTSIDMPRIAPLNACLTSFEGRRAGGGSAESSTRG
ncbi:hypothetical protein [Actinomadura sp. 3N407]|uniref:hypothetical protein n=1 Tax=Actinomadura sp. 3N407 TaxID=3457423 RepID=UPI003FCEC6F0